MTDEPKSGDPNEIVYVDVTGHEVTRREWEFWQDPNDRYCKEHDRYKPCRDCMYPDDEDDE